MRMWIPTAALAAALLTAACAMPPPPGSPETGYAVWGWVGQSATMPAANVMVILADGKTGRPVAGKNTNAFGRFEFKGVAPGHYKIRVGGKELELFVEDENVRVDVDLGSESGVMDYTKAAGAGAAPGSPGGDPELAKRFAGRWYGFSGGSTLSGGGGSESRLVFCADGTYHESYESGYYGGDASMAWGQAGQSGGDGTWSIEGTVESGRITVRRRGGDTIVIEYRRAEDPQCTYFDGRLHCYEGPCG